MTAIEKKQVFMEAAYTSRLLGESKQHFLTYSYVKDYVKEDDREFIYDEAIRKGGKENE